LASVCSALRQIRTLSRKITGFLFQPTTFTARAANKLFVGLSSLIGTIREIPPACLTSPKRKVIKQLKLATTALQANSSTPATLQNILDILQATAVELLGCGICC
jgi:hypothetical protein